MFDISGLEDNKQKIQKDLKELTPVLASIQVVDQDSLDQATEYAWKCQARIKRIEELRTQYKKPVLEFGKMIETWAKNLSSPYELALGDLKGKMKVYHTEQDRIAREAQEKLRIEQEKQAKIAREQAEAEAKKLADAQKTATPTQAQDLSAEELIMWATQALVPAQPAIEVKHDSKSKTVSGSSFTRKTWKFEVTDPTLVPREFLVVNDALIRDAVKNGSREIAGVRIYEDIDVSIRA